MRGGFEVFSAALKPPLPLLEGERCGEGEASASGALIVAEAPSLRRAPSPYLSPMVMEERGRSAPRRSGCIGASLTRMSQPAHD